VEGSFEDLLDRAEIRDFRFHDLRHTFASWYMMNGGDLYELAKILGHSNIKMTERYAKLARQHIARTSSTAREMWKLLEPACDKAQHRMTDVRVLFARPNLHVFGYR
jgi:integrase